MLNGEAGAGDGGELAVPRPVPTTLQGFANCDECDLVTVVPWAGPAIDEETGELAGPLPERYLVAIGNGWPRPDAEETSVDMIQVLMDEGWTKYGMLAATFAYSPRCWGSAKSLSVWRDPESMGAFVRSDMHMTAVRRVKKVMYAWESTHWVGGDTTKLPTFEEAKVKLAEVRTDHPIRVA